MIEAIPRIWTSGAETVAANGTLALSADLYKNDGDWPARIDAMILDYGLTSAAQNWVEPRMIVRPTNAPAWMRRAVPLALLVREFGSGNPLSPHYARLDHPIALGPNDGIDVSVYNGDGSTAAVAAVAFVGYKRSGAKAEPFAFKSPRILWDRITGLVTASSRRFDGQYLQNFGDKPMTVHAMAFRAADATSDLTGNNVHFRVRQGGRAWMQLDDFVLIDVARSVYTRQIRVPDIVVPPDSTFDVEVYNNSGSSITVDVAVIGSIDVEAMA